MGDNEDYTFGSFRLSAGRHELLAHGQPVLLGSRAIDLLFALVKRQGKVATKDELMAEVWPGMVVEENNISVQISALRKVLGEDPEIVRCLVTVPGRGYRFVAQIVRVADSPVVPAQSESAPGMTVSSDGPVKLALPDKPSIAVLPFTNMSGDPDQEYFADGMAEEILTALARCSGLFVIARNSSFTYKGRIVDVRQIGSELGVRYLLQGSVRRSGHRLRITSQLVDTASGTHVWADRFDGEPSDVFDLQDRITEKVVSVIEPTLQLAEIARIRHKTPANLNAYDHLLRAQQLEFEFTERSIEAALHHLKQALAIDDGYAPAMALAATCYGWRYMEGWSKDIAAESTEGLRLAARALELNKFDATILWMCAVAVWILESDTKRALELAYRSLDANPNSAIALTIGGRIEVLSGNYATGRQLLERALRLSPRDPRAWLMTTGMGAASFAEDRFEEGVSWARRALAQNPHCAPAIRMLAINLAQLGQLADAAKAIADNLRIEPGLTITSFRSRRMFVDERYWQKVCQALRLAGLPE